ncbi:MAG: Transcriptional regulator, AraC family [Bradyrhizobium sp.]|nr:Transcriptional regulator, AraC family [Bradyrhizobium sp.]
MIPAPPHLRFEAWKDQIRKMGGRFDPQVIDPKAFAGWVRPISAYGLIAAEVGSNAHVVERTHRHVRVDGADHYVVLFQLAGRSAMTYNEEAVRVGVGDVAFVDMGRPATFFAGNAGESWNTMALLLPRQALVSHLGFEPRGGLYRRRGTAIGRLLLDLIRNAGEEGLPPSRTDCYVRLAVYDLVGALFAPSDPAPARHSDKLFMRVRCIIKDGFADPDLDPCEVAARAGISLRYLQKLFTQRGSTCSEFIYSFRLDYAAHLLQRQSALGASRAFREIAYASGFRDYSHFARKFRQRFGHAPGAHFAGESCGRTSALDACG